MWQIFGILAAAIAIIGIEVPRLRRKGLEKELWVFSLLLFFGTGLGIAKSLNLPIPNPLDWIIAVYKPASDALTRFLE
jgi:hypothetical protein